LVPGLNEKSVKDRWLRWQPGMNGLCGVLCCFVEAIFAWTDEGHVPGDIANLFGVHDDFQIRAAVSALDLELDS
jgi:hypothetical protein